MDLLFAVMLMYIVALGMLTWIDIGSFLWESAIAGLFSGTWLVALLVSKKEWVAFAVSILVCLCVVHGDKVRTKHVNDAKERAPAVQEESMQKEKENLRREKRELIKEFALKESPSMWEIFQNLEATIVNQRNQLDSVKQTLESFGRKAEDDNDYAVIKRRLDKLVIVRMTLWQRMVQAYIQSCKFKVSSGDAQQRELCRTAMDNAVREAELAKKRYQEMMEVTR